MFKNILFISALLLVSQFSNAQNVAGYQGKRFLAEYNFQPSIRILFKGGLQNTVHDFHVGYVVSKRFQVGLALDLYAPAIQDYENIKIKGVGVGANIDYYIKNNRAPVGPFIRGEFRYLNANNSFGEIVSRASIGGGFGIRRIIRDRFTVNFGAMLAWVTRQNDMAGFVMIQEAVGEKEIQSLFLYRLNIGVGVLLF